MFITQATMKYGEPKMPGRPGSIAHQIYPEELPFPLLLLAPTIRTLCS